MTYNLTAIGDNTTGILTFTQSVNTILLDGFLGILFLIGVSVVILMAFVHVTSDIKRSIVATSFISFTLALLLRAVNLVPDLAIFVTLIIAAGMIAITFKR